MFRTHLSQVSKLQTDALPMQESNAELSEKSGMLQAEKKLLEEEIKRWKARTQVSTQTRCWFKFPLWYINTDVGIILDVLSLLFLFIYFLLRDQK